MRGRRQRGQLLVLRTQARAMLRQRARRLLDAVKDGQNVDPQEVTRALRILGDLGGERLT